MVLGAVVMCGCTPTVPSADPTTSVPPAEAQRRSADTIQPAAPPGPTGVPGLTAADPFCSSFASYAGTLQALGTAASFGDLAGDRFAALELLAAPRLVDDAAAIGSSWPSELAAERTVVVEQRIGPFARRAQRGVEALSGAGVSAAELVTLSAVWEAALLARDPASPVIVLPPVADELRAKVDAAGHAYDAAFTPFAQDPSLVVDGLTAPETDAYLVAHCPDLVSSGVGDAS